MKREVKQQKREEDSRREVGNLAVDGISDGRGIGNCFGTSWAARNVALKRCTKTESLWRTDNFRLSGSFSPSGSSSSFARFSDDQRPFPLQKSSTHKTMTDNQQDDHIVPEAERSTHGPPAMDIGHDRPTPQSVSQIVEAFDNLCNTQNLILDGTSYQRSKGAIDVETAEELFSLLTQVAAVHRAGVRDKSKHPRYSSNEDTIRIALGAGSAPRRSVERQPFSPPVAQMPTPARRLSHAEIMMLARTPSTCSSVHDTNSSSNTSSNRLLGGQVSSTGSAVDLRSTHSTQSLNGLPRVIERQGTLCAFDDGRTTLCEYEILGEIGRGSYGTVVIAVADGQDEPVAIKTMFRKVIHRPATILQDGEPPAATTGVKRNSPAVPHLGLTSNATEREIALMKRLRHKNLVRLHAVIEDEEEEQVHLVMQYIDNGPIAKLRRDGTCDQLPIDDVIHYMVQVSRALDYLHKRKILHRDVKPENILVGKDRSAYVADFGVSSFITDVESATRGIEPAVQAGTLPFFSPELCVDRNALHKYGPQCDVWAFGVTVYALLFGKLPFFGWNPPSTIRSIMADPPVFPVEKLDSQHPKSEILVTLLSELLHKDPEKRITLKRFRTRLLHEEGSPLARDRRCSVPKAHDPKLCGSNTDTEGELVSASQHSSSDEGHSSDGEKVVLVDAAGNGESANGHNEPLVTIHDTSQSNSGSDRTYSDSTDLDMSSSSGGTILLNENEIHDSITRRQYVSFSHYIPVGRGRPPHAPKATTPRGRFDNRKQVAALSPSEVPKAFLPEHTAESEVESTGFAPVASNEESPSKFVQRLREKTSH